MSSIDTTRTDTLRPPVLPQNSSQLLNPLANQGSQSLATKLISLQLSATTPQGASLNLTAAVLQMAGQSLGGLKNNPVYPPLGNGLLPGLGNTKPTFQQLGSSIGAFMDAIVGSDPKAGQQAQGDLALGMLPLIAMLGLSGSSAGSQSQGGQDLGKSMMLMGALLMQLGLSAETGSATKPMADLLIGLLMSSLLQPQSGSNSGAGADLGKLLDAILNPGRNSTPFQPSIVNDLLSSFAGTGQQPDLSALMGALNQAAGNALTPTRTTTADAPTTPPMDNGKAIRTIADNFDAIATNGTISKSDLQRVADDSSKPELAAAAQHVLDNPALFDMLETSHGQNKKGAQRSDHTDGLIGKKDMEVARAQANTTDVVGMTNDQAMRLLSRDFDKVSSDGKSISEADLHAAAKNTKEPELAKAAQFLLDNKTLRDGLDTAQQLMGDGNPSRDGRISRGDLTVGMRETTLTAGDKSITDALTKYKDALFGHQGRGTLSTADVESMSKGGKMPDGRDTPLDLQQAMKDLLIRPELMSRLDTSHMMSNSDTGNRSAGKIGNDYADFFHGVKDRSFKDDKFTLQDLNALTSMAKPERTSTTSFNPLSPTNGLGDDLQKSTTAGKTFESVLFSAISSNLKAQGMDIATIEMLLNSGNRSRTPAYA